MRVLLIFLLLFLLSISSTKASRNLIISSEKSSLNAGEEMLINASPSGFATSEAVFIKGAFFKEGETNYFGFTKYGNNWIKNSDPTESQLQININSWDGKLNIKSDYNDSGFKGSGSYKLKVGFYYTTSGGNISSVNWSSNVLDISLVAPTPIPDPTPAPTPSPPPSPSPTVFKNSAPSPSPKNIQKTLEPSLTPSAVPTVTPEAQVLGVKSEVVSVSQTPNATQNLKTNNINLFAYGLTGAGILIIALSIYLSLKASK